MLIVVILQDFLTFRCPLVAEKGTTAVYQKGLKVAFNDTCRRKTLGSSYCY